MARPTAAEDTPVFEAQGSSLELCCRKVDIQIYVCLLVFWCVVIFGYPHGKVKSHGM
jgi:hypothetical protein